MKVSLNWIKEFIDLPFSSEKISDALTLAGLEVEGMEEIGNDLIFEIGLTPNLGHCMSMIGIARELAAIFNIPLKHKEISFDESNESIEKLIRVDIEATTSCHKYCARVVKGVKMGPSPSWLREKLEKVGIRSVNLIVDIGNLVMMELGQPLHMFDYDSLNGEQIIVREAENDGKIETLDGVERPIENGALLICDEKKPIAFAGVMGDLPSAVSEKTKNVLIEAAHFTPEAVRKTSKLLNLRSESSLRFERGIDPSMIEPALDLAASLLGGEICNGIVEATTHEHSPQQLVIDPRQANRLLGLNLSVSEMTAIFNRLQIKVLSESENAIEVEVPSYRNDLRAEIDLIEEIGRLYGFNNIPRRHPRHVSSPLTHSPLYLMEQEVRAKLVAQGLQECLTCDLISPTLAKLAFDKSHIHVLHPASIDQSVLRSSLLPGLLEVIKHNLDRQNRSIAAFEVGHIHFEENGEFFQEPSVAIILSGNETPYHFDKKPIGADFYDLKGHVENLLDSLGLDQIFSFEKSHLKSLHPTRQARIAIDDIFVGILGEVHPRILRDLGIDQRVYFAEINLHNLIELKKSHRKAKTFSVLPGSERDLTITLDQKVAIGSILDELRQLNSPILEEVFLLDLYKSEKIGKDRKNATFRFRYRDPKKTVEASEVEKEHKRIIHHINTKWSPDKF